MTTLPPPDKAPLHPTAAAMAAIGLALASDGQPTTEDDLCQFTPAERANYWPAARAEIHRRVVRQIDDEDLESVEAQNPDPQAQTLRRCVRQIAPPLFDRLNIKAMLRANGFSPDEIKVIWPDLIPALAAEFQRAQLGGA